MTIGPEKLEIRINRFITKAEEGTFIEVPFEMRSHMDEISVEIQVEDKSDQSDPSDQSKHRAVIDLGIRDSNRVRGWSGGARTHFQIGKERATPGYLAGELGAGEWAVILGAYQVPEEGCQVELFLTFTYESPRWLKGDLHGHSVHSDGSYTLTEIAEIIEQQGMDFVGLMDHNTASQNYAYPKDTSVLFIPGMELTTYKGHCNLFGAADPVQDFRTPNVETLAERLQEAKDKGAYISINHPHDRGCPSCSWQWGWEIEYDWVEVWNGPWRPNNLETLNWWHNQLVSGKRLTAVGGSDTHRPHPYVKHGMPTNWVYSRSRSVKGILEAIHQGHVVLTYAPEGPFIQLQYGPYQIGDEVPKSERSNHSLGISIQDLIVGDQIRILSNRGVESELQVEEEHDFADFTHSLLVEDQLFVRVEVWRYFSSVDQYLMASMTNPIYFAAN